MIFSKLKIPLLFLLAIIATICGYQMYHLPLWGHRPLILFIAIWSFYILAIEHRFSKLPQNRKLLLWSTLSGIILSIGFPISPFTPLMFIGFVPLLIVEKIISDYRSSPSKWEVFKYSYHAFVVWNILTTYWVSNSASFMGGVIAVWLNAFFMTIPFVLFHQARKVMQGNFGYVAFIANWLAWEYLHLRWEISWPWLTLGNSFAQYPSWVQWFEYTGVFGGSLWILITNLLIFRWVVIPFFLKNQKVAKSNYLKIVAIILIPILFSHWRYHTYKPIGKEVEVVVVQPNFEPHYQKFTIPKLQQLDRFIELSRNTLTKNTTYLVFPETSFGFFDIDQLERQEVIRKLRALVNDYPRLKLVMGISAYKFFKKGEKLTDTSREIVDKRTGEIRYWESYNAAIQLESGNSAIQFYKKSKLVPGAEILPYHELFFIFKPIVDQLGGTMAGFGPQSNRIPFTSNSGNIGTQICYESIYGEYSTGYIREGANALFVITNDGWWDDTPGYQQHLKFASLRAIETRKSIARSANTGISAFINQRGDILQATAYEETIAIKGNIRLNDTITFYVAWGDLIGRLAVFTFILLFLNTIVKGKLKNAT